MMTIQVFDPAMCCSSGVCGPEVDPALPRFAADLEWLKSQGVAVTRYNLAQQPLAFAQNETVRAALQADAQCLPLVLVAGQVVSRKTYPSREELARAAGLGPAVGATERTPAASCCGGSGCCR